MNIIKFVLIGVVSLVALLLIVAMFTKKDYGVIREVVINKPKSEVFEYVKLLQNQENFSVWANKDPEMKKDFRGTDGTVGFVSAWDSKMKDVGKANRKLKRLLKVSGLITSSGLLNHLLQPALHTSHLKVFPKLKPKLNGVLQEK